MKHPSRHSDFWKCIQITTIDLPEILVSYMRIKPDERTRDAWSNVRPWGDVVLRPQESRRYRGGCGGYHSCSTSFVAASISSKGVTYSPPNLGGLPTDPTTHYDRGKPMNGSPDI